MKLIKVKGIVIKEVKTGEADKIITIFTRKLGKIQAVAKGARRPQSRLIAGTQFLSFSDFVLFKGKDIYSIRDCNVIESFYNIRNDLTKITYAAHVIDLVDEVSDENLSYYNLLKLLLNTLYVLTNTEKDAQLIILIFELRLMSMVGFTPQVFECANCKKENNLYYFSASLGGIICDECFNSNKKLIRVSKGTINALKYVIYSDLNKIFSFEVSNDVLAQLRNISRAFLSEHLDKEFEKLNFLDVIRSGNNNA